METGVYAIRDPCAGDRAFSNSKIHVRCNMETNCGGWIVIQRRNASLGIVNFTRNWEDYEDGFGDINGEFWIGLKNMYEFTNQQDVELQISVWNDTRTAITWNYPIFRVSSPGTNYQLTISGGSGNGRNIFAYQSGRYFTTYDRDNSGYRCGYNARGGWWYYSNYCTYANLNGVHEMSGIPETEGIQQKLTWNSGGNQYKVYTNSEMKIRSKTCTLGC